MPTWAVATKFVAELASDFSFRQASLIKYGKIHGIKSHGPWELVQSPPEDSMGSRGLKLTNQIT